MSGAKNKAKITVAVLPFQNISMDQELNYFIVGFTEDIITDLSRFSSLQIISSNSTSEIDPEKENIRNLTVQIRYGHKAAPARLDWDKTLGIVTFDTPQNAVTPGQAAVFYDGNRVLGAGFIQ